MASGILEDKSSIPVLGDHIPGLMVEDAPVVLATGVDNSLDSMDTVGAVHSPFPTEVDVTDVEMICDSPVKGGCYCDQLEHPDRQPESFEEFEVCGCCQAARNHVDDMDTQVDVVALESAATTMIENSMDHSKEHGLDGGEMSPLLKKPYRRLEPLIIVDSPEPARSSVEEDGFCYSPSICPDGLATGDVCSPADDLPSDPDELSQSVDVSWFNNPGIAKDKHM